MVHDQPEIKETDVYYFLDSEMRGLKEVSGDQSMVARCNRIRNQLMHLPRSDAMKLIEVFESMVLNSRGTRKTASDLMEEKQKEEEKALLDSTLYQRKMRQQPAVKDLAVAKA